MQSREKQFQTVRQNDICKAFFEPVLKKASIVAMRDIRTVPLDRSFYFLLTRDKLFDVLVYLLSC